MNTEISLLEFAIDFSKTRLLDRDFTTTIYYMLWLQYHYIAIFTYVLRVLEILYIYIYIYIYLKLNIIQLARGIASFTFIKESSVKRYKTVAYTFLAVSILANIVGASIERALIDINIQGFLLAIYLFVLLGVYAFSYKNTKIDIKILITSGPRPTPVDGKSGKVKKASQVIWIPQY